VRKTRDLLQRIAQEQARCRSIFNGRNLEGWTRMHGGEWSVRHGELLGRNGSGWSTNPEVSGSWLSSQKQYGDFRLELQYRINQNGNSGVFFRSSHQKNPAYTGYEMQVYGAPGTPPSKHGPGSIYDLAAPTSNPVRSADQWNSVTLIARGPSVVVEMNGERILETKLDRSMRGYIGLQIHDEKSEVRYRNIRVEEL